MRHLDAAAELYVTVPFQRRTTARAAVAMGIPRAPIPNDKSQAGFPGEQPSRAMRARAQSAKTDFEYEEDGKSPPGGSRPNVTLRNGAASSSRPRSGSPFSQCLA